MEQLFSIAEYSDTLEYHIFLSNNKKDLNYRWDPRKPLCGNLDIVKNYEGVIGTEYNKFTKKDVIDICEKLDSVVCDKCLNLIHKF